MLGNYTWIFCGTPFWNSNLFWQSDFPIFTRCFQGTVFAWLPSLVLFAGICVKCIILKIHKLKGKNDPKTLRISTGLTITTFTTARYMGIIGLFVLYIAKDTYCWLFDSLISFPTDLIKTVNCVIVFCMLLQNDRSGDTGLPTALTVFWFVLFSFNTFFLVNLWMISSYNTMNAIYFLTPILENLLILFNFSSIFHDDYLHDKVLLRVKSSKNLFHSYYTTVMSSLIWSSNKKIVKLENLLPLLESVHSRISFKGSILAWFKSMENDSKVRDKKQYVGMGILKLYWKPLMFGFLLSCFHISLRSISIEFLKLCISYISLRQPTWLGVMYAAGIFSTEFIIKATFDYICQLSNLTAIKLKWHLMYLVFNKTLHMRPDSVRDPGQMINYAAIDVDNIFAIKDKISVILCIPAVIVMSVVYLWTYFGSLSLIGWSFCLALLPFVSYLSIKAKVLQERCMELKDQRLKQINEVLHFIKTIKCCTWEPIFVKRVENIRKQEGQLLAKISYCTAIIRFFSECIPSLVSVFVFLAFTFLKSDGEFDAETVFITMTVLGTLKLTFNVLPDLFNIFVQLTVSFKRLGKFLENEYSHSNLHISKTNEKHFLRFINVSLSRSEAAQPTLQNISFSLKKGQLAAVVGSVGSGKSSLLEAVVGNMTVIEGNIYASGSLAYVPQESFILNDTSRENVIFGAEFNTERFEEAVGLCCLKPDLEYFYLKDLTVIGERGITISGGQKQRLSLARAVYRNSDIYLLDDPLSAVDIQVRKTIFSELIGPFGILKKKLRLFVTNDLSLVSAADIILYVNDGTVKTFTRYEDFIRIYCPSAASSCKCTPRNITDKNIDKFVDIFDRNHASKQVNDNLTDEETSTSGRIRFNVYCSFFKNIGVIPTCLIFISYVSYQGLQIFSGLWLEQWTSNGNLTANKNIYFAILYCLFGICQGISFLIGSALLFKSTVKSGTRFHERMLSCLVRAPGTFFDCNPAGRILNRFGKDLDQIDVMLPDTANRIFTCGLEFLGILILISVKMPMFVVFALVTLTVLTAYNKFYMTALRQMHRLESVTRSPVFSLITQCVNGLTSIKAYNVEKQFLKSLNKRMKINLNCCLNLSYSSLWYISRGNTISSMTAGFVVLLITLKKDSMTPGESGLLISYAINFTALIAYAVLYASQLDSCFIAAERLEEYCNIPNEGELYSQNKNVENSKGQIAFRNFSARYREGLDPVLENINYEIISGEKIGIVGRTGAGKSSLILSLFRLLQRVHGDILISNVSIYDMGLHTLRNKLTIIPQMPTFFSGTLRFNLDPGNLHSDAELYLALEKVHLKHVFPDGLSTSLSSNTGMMLSVGQRQLVCLARAFLARASILVLDEATASVDLNTDFEIQKVITEAFLNCTVLKIAHRVQSVLDCSKIIVMDNGRIAERGFLEDLLKDRSSLFNRLVAEV